MRYLVILLALLLPLPAHAQRIVASVNDEAITSADLEGRMRLALLGSGAKPDKATTDRLAEQILRAMIDERIELQEARRLGLTVTDKELAEQKARLAAQNKLPADQLDGFFTRAGVPTSALEDQLRASLAWGKVVQRVIRPRVNISDEAVDAEIARLNANAGKPEFLVAELFLPVDRPQQDDEVRQSGAKLLEQMSQGALFSGLARQFSQAASAATGGDIGWVQPGQLAPELDKALLEMKPGTVSPPIRTVSGYYLLMLRQVRTGQRVSEAGATPAGEAPAATPAPPPVMPKPVALKPVKAAKGPVSYTIRQVLLPVKPDAKPDELRRVAEKAEAQRATAKSCADMKRLAQQNGDQRGGEVGTIKSNKIPPPLEKMLSRQPDNTPTALMRNKQGLLFLMVCARSKPLPAGETIADVAPAAGPETVIDRAKIVNTLGNQQLELQARGYLRDLRQNAFIEVRD